MLSFPGFAIETENNNTLSRVAVYLDNRISYIRRRDLEGVNSNLLILDLVSWNPVQLINVYRSFSRQHNINQRDKFTIQLQLIKAAYPPMTIILGDFNLDWNKKFDASFVVLIRDDLDVW